MSDNQCSVGDHIDARCTKCKAVTNHIIVAMVEQKVARVECNTCGGIHNYRKVAAKKPAKKSRATNTKTSKIDKIEAEWETLLNHANPADATVYNKQMSIKAGELLQHPSFGLGRVINVIRPNKMEVFFRSGIKLLRCSTA